MKSRHRTPLSISNLALMGIIIFFQLLSSCQTDTSPKPRGYIRIDLPEHEYRVFDTTYPYSFDLPVYAIIQADPSPDAEPYWANIDYPAFNARIHLSYKPVEKNLDLYLEDAHKMVMTHIAKSSGIREKVYENPGHQVYGTIFDIRGTSAASPLQFYATDSMTHFIRGALYFNQNPNNDSLAPVISFIEHDIRHLLETLRWK